MSTGYQTVSSTQNKWIKRILTCLFACLFLSGAADEPANNLSEILSEESFEQGLREYGVSSLEPISTEEVLKSFGAYIDDRGRLIVRPSASRIMPRKVNLLDVLQLEEELANNMVNLSSCGSRGFEIVYVPYNGSPLESLSLLYPCEGGCFAILERHEETLFTERRKLKAITDKMPQPIQLCRALWDGTIPLGK